MNYTALGNRIKKLRRQKRLTQEQLAEQAAISASFLGHIERGTRVASIESLVAICNTLEISPEYLLCDNVSAKATDTLRQDQVDFPFHRIVDHALEVQALVYGGAADAPILVDVNQHPGSILLDTLFKMVHLHIKAALLFFFLGADLTVGTNAQLGPFALIRILLYRRMDDHNALSTFTVLQGLLYRDFLRFTPLTAATVTSCLNNLGI
jgi:transcriptional regulator with XRE-family HTH domain